MSSVCCFELVSVKMKVLANFVCVCVCVSAFFVLGLKNQRFFFCCCFSKITFFIHVFVFDNKRHILCKLSNAGHR